MSIAVINDTFMQSDTGIFSFTMTKKNSISFIVEKVEAYHQKPSKLNNFFSVFGDLLFFMAGLPCIEKSYLAGIKIIE